MQSGKTREIALPVDLVQSKVDLEPLQEVLQGVVQAVNLSQENYSSLSTSLDSHTKQLAAHSHSLTTQAKDFQASLSHLSSLIPSKESIQKVIVPSI